jgi:sulfate adenylyltransferase subunit 1 (EFTu-like GTPase family)
LRDNVLCDSVMCGNALALYIPTRSRHGACTQVTFVPCSGLAGENLSAPPAAAVSGASWYEGPTLLETLDALGTKVRDDAGAIAGMALRVR